MKSSAVLSMAVLAAMQFLTANATTPSQPPVQTPTALPLPGTRTSHGCYSSKGNMTLHPVKDMSSGVCNDLCTAKNFWVSGLHADDCYCGYAYPPKADLVKDSDCKYPCPNYPLEACGGLGNPGYWTIFNTGVNVNAIDYDPPDTSTTATPSKTAAPATSHTADPDSETSQSKADKSGGPNVAAIAAGVVSGVVVAAAVIGGAFFYVRRRRNAEIEEEHRRNAAVNAFISGSKPPGSSGSISMTDSRLDPVMAHRRLSDGSIADNQDYSRRILRVTNA